MKNRLLGIAALGFMLAASILVATPARAQTVDDKIKVLEQELSQLKEQQISLKKEKNQDKAKIIKQMNLSCFEALNSWRGILHFVHKFGSTQIIREIKWCEHTCT